MKKYLLISVIAILTACSAKLIPVGQPDADRSVSKFPGTTLADLQQGQTLFKENCGKCHGLKAPAARTEAQWREIVPKMAKKAKVDARTEDLILRYVVTMSEAGK